MNSNSFNKTEQLLAYLVKGSDRVSITSLMKFAYIVDLVSMKECQKAISEFKYVRYTYGPFDQKIYPHIETLVSAEVIIGQMFYTNCNEEYIVYRFVSDDFNFNLLSEEEQKLIDGVVDKLRGYGAKALTDLAYNTKPMIKLGAALGNEEGLNKKLDLTANS